MDSSLKRPSRRTHRGSKHRRRRRRRTQVSVGGVRVKLGGRGLKLNVRRRRANSRIMDSHCAAQALHRSTSYGTPVLEGAALEELKVLLHLQMKMFIEALDKLFDEQDAK
ncbi:hypothetical protein EJB05_27230, partial [Eragrostis curvula]